jgi:dTDP-4-dehydrorhamnose 3,5-epimerase-like enzyme
MVYKNTSVYNPKSDGGINPFCQGININWGISIKDAILSPKDRAAQSLTEYGKNPKF